MEELTGRGFGWGGEAKANVGNNVREFAYRTVFSERDLS